MHLRVSEDIQSVRVLRDAMCRPLLEVTRLVRDAMCRPLLEVMLSFDYAPNNRVTGIAVRLVPMNKSHIKISTPSADHTISFHSKWWAPSLGEFVEKRFPFHC